MSNTITPAELQNLRSEYKVKRLEQFDLIKDRLLQEHVKLMKRFAKNGGNGYCLKDIRYYCEDLTEEEVNLHSEHQALINKHFKSLGFEVNQHSEIFFEKEENNG